MVGQGQEIFWVKNRTNVRALFEGGAGDGKIQKLGALQEDEKNGLRQKETP